MLTFFSVRLRFFLRLSSSIVDDEATGFFLGGSTGRTILPRMVGPVGLSRSRRNGASFTGARGASGSGAAVSGAGGASASGCSCCCGLRRRPLRPATGSIASGWSKIGAWSSHSRRSGRVPTGGRQAST
jgi:hypothetical protein